MDPATLVSICLNVTGMKSMWEKDLITCKIYELGFQQLILENIGKAVGQLALMTIWRDIGVGIVHPLWVILVNICSIN